MSLSDPLTGAMHAATACDGKQRFETLRLAQQVLLRSKYSRPGRAAYRCQHCGGFHLGTSNRKKAAR